MHNVLYFKALPCHRDSQKVPVIMQGTISHVVKDDSEKHGKFFI